MKARVPKVDIKQMQADLLKCKVENPDTKALIKNNERVDKSIEALNKLKRGCN